MWFLNQRLAEDAGALGLDDAFAVGVQLDVVADAAAEGAGRVLDNRQAPSLVSLYRLIWPSEPDGMTNVQPSSRPDAAAADAPRHVPAGLDHLPGRVLLGERLRG